MSLPTITFNLLQTLVAGRVHPDVAEQGEPLPYITYQQVGGKVIDYLDDTVPNKRNARLQVNVWAATRLEADALGDQVEQAFILAPVIQARPMGALVSLHEPDTNLYGTTQDFSVWFDR